ncbi:MAG: M48 family metalloprotease [Desulfobacteraceae bacterium]|nr:M48 family metalloprotease [Desulfobacteraceae bacterium]
MYSQLIYFVCAILMYSFYQPNETPFFSVQETLLLVLLVMMLFSLVTGIRFSRLAKQSGPVDHAMLESRFTKISTQHTLAALGLFGLMIYGLCLPDFLMKPDIVSVVPSLASFAGILIFLLLMMTVWKFSHKLYCRIYHNPVSLFSFIRSNFAFALPALTFWITINFCSDLLNLVPHEGFHGFITSDHGDVLFFLVFMAMALIAGPAMIQKLWGCKPLEPGPHRNCIESFCNKAEMKFSDVLYWPLFGGKMITAGIMGLAHPFRYILVSPALLRLLTADELEAVMAHEIGHVKKNHMTFYLFFLSGFVIFIYVLIEILTLLVYSLSYSLDDGLGIMAHASTLTHITESACFILGFVLYFRFIFGFFMRNFERQADTYIFTMMENAVHLIHTFEKIAMNSGISSNKPNWHHFSIRERIGFLKACENDKSLVETHDKKLKKSLILFSFVLVFFSLILYSPVWQNHKQQVLSQAFLHDIQGQMEKDPENPALYELSGNVYQELKSYEKAVVAYETALKLSPDNPRILNNFAWLLATCPMPQIRNPEKAVALASKAAGIMPAPEFLDTLAESLFGTGQIQKAMENSAKALEAAKANPMHYGNQMEYYEGQRKKFADKSLRP